MSQFFHQIKPQQSRLRADPEEGRCLNPPVPLKNPDSNGDLSGGGSINLRFLPLPKNDSHLKEKF